MELYLLRHGESVNNTLPESEHRPDPELTVAGRRQARHLAAAVAPLRPVVVLSSPLLRSLQTAQPLVAALGVPWLVWADVAEAHRAHPDDGQATAELARRFPGARLEPGMRWPGYPGAEDRERAAERARGLLVRLRQAFPGLRVAVVGHGNLNAYLLRAVIGAPQDRSVRVEQANACINELSLAADGAAQLVRCNDCRHLG